MKKFLSVLIALAMFFSFAACSSESNEFAPARGGISGNVYENTAFGIKYSAGENWYYYTDEEIAETMGATIEAIFPDGSESLAETEIIYDMYCMDAEKGSTVNVNYENVGLVYGEILDEKSYLEVSSSGITEAFEAMGVEIIRNEIGTAEVDGKEVPCAYVTINVYGMEFYEVLVVKKVENWMGVVTLASFSEEELPAMLLGLSFE